MNLIKKHFEPLYLSWSRRELLFNTVIVTLKQRYAGTILGVAWIFIGQIIFLLLYSLIYLVVFKVRPIDMSSEAYVIYIFCGLIPLINFSQGLVQGSASLSADSGVLLNTVFPPELIPMRESMVAMVTMSCGMVLILIGGFFLGKASIVWFMVPLVLMLLSIFLIGVTWILSLANLLIKDVQQLLAYVTIILLIASPIAYTKSMLPSALQSLIYFNPLAYYIISMQDLIVLGTMPDLPIIMGMFVFSFSSLLIGAYVFGRAKQAFFDYA